MTDGFEQPVIEGQKLLDFINKFTTNIRLQRVSRVGGRRAYLQRYRFSNNI